MDKSKQDKMNWEEIETADEREVVNVEENVDPRDVNFQSELSYDGYHSIEESDNDAYGSLDSERNEDSATEELMFVGRKENAKMGEENLVDPQENRNKPPVIGPLDQGSQESHPQP